MADDTITLDSACEVTAGPNKGKKGVYTTDDFGNVWCESDTIATQCSPSSKCKDDAPAIRVVDPGNDADGVVYEVDGLYEVEDAGAFYVRGSIDAGSGENKNLTAVPVVATPLATLRASGSEVDRTVADAISSRVKSIRYK